MANEDDVIEGNRRHCHGCKAEIYWAVEHVCPVLTAIQKELVDAKLQVDQLKDEIGCLKQRAGEAVHKLYLSELQVSALMVVLKAFVAADDGGFDTRHAAENSYCPDCATDAEAWKDQTEHHNGCAYLARMESAKAAIAKVEPAVSEKRLEDCATCEHGNIHQRGVMTCAICNEAGHPAKRSEKKIRGGPKCDHAYGVTMSGPNRGKCVDCGDQRVDTGTRKHECRRIEQADGSMYCPECNTSKEVSGLKCPICEALLSSQAVTRCVNGHEFGRS